MKKKTSQKIIFPIVGSTLISIFLFGCGCDNGNKPVDETVHYDVTERTPIDENETVVDLTERDYAYYNNYIELYDGDGDVYDVGDPYVFRYDGKYYLYSSLNNKKETGKIPCWSSDNLVDWTWEAWAYDPKSTSDTSETYIAFAPEVVYYKGYFYLCESRRGQGHYFFKSSSPSSGFELLTDRQGNANLGMGIDGSFYLHDDGQLYFMSADNTKDNRIDFLKIDFVEDEEKTYVELDPNGSQNVATAYLNGWTEGPGYFKRNGYSYITYTGNHVDCADYRVGYSYARTDFALTNDYAVKDDNILLISSGIDNSAIKGYNSNDETAFTNYRGLGHSSNVVGPNLDSVFTAYHNANRIDYNNRTVSSGRKYNLTQYFTNNSFVLTNGVGNYQRVKPDTATYQASVEDLEKDGSLSLSKVSTDGIFTAELCFGLTAEKEGSAIVGYQNANRYFEIEVNGQTLTLYKVVNGSRTAVANKTVSISTNANAVHTVKVIAGNTKTEICYDNMRVIETTEKIGVGKVGYGNVGKISSTTFTNDAYGTSDFNAVKDLTGTFQSFAYMKGENVGYSIKNATVKENGVRQGEKESTKYVASLDAVSTVLEKGDWVKYTVNAPEDGTYAVNMLLGKASAGCVFEAVVDNQTITKMDVARDAFNNSEYANATTGTCTFTKGVHTLKLRVYHGTLDFVNVKTEKNAQSIGAVSASLETEGENVLRTVIGKFNYTKTNNLSGILIDRNSPCTFLAFGNQGVANYEFSFDVNNAFEAEGVKILFRASNFSYTSTVDHPGVGKGDSYQGYFLEMGTNTVKLAKTQYDTNKEIKTIRPSFDDGFKSENVVNVKVWVKDGNIKVYLNGDLYFDYFDDCAYLNGSIGILSEKNNILVANFNYKEIER